MSDATHLRHLIGFLEEQLATPADERSPGTDERTIVAALEDARAALEIVAAGGEADMDAVVRALQRASEQGAGTVVDLAADQGQRR